VIMASGGRSGLTLSLALAASVCVSAPSSAQNGGVTARSAQIAELSRAGKYSKAHGPDHRDVAASLNNLADLYERQSRFAGAEPLYQRALAIREQAAGPDHPETATLPNNLASFYQAQGRYTDALPTVERTIAGGRAQPRVALAVLSGAQQQQLLPAEMALDDALNAIQRGTQSSAAAAVNKLAVRLAAGNGRLAELVRRDQDLSVEMEALDKAIVAAASKEQSKRDVASEQRARARLAGISTERARLQKVLAAEFPDYVALSNPLPMTSQEIQALLSGRRSTGAVFSCRQGELRLCDHAQEF
jgi:tetratricopeptide (TPR) repeat protein